MFGSKENNDYLRKVYKEDSLFVVEKNAYIGEECEIVENSFSTMAAYYVINKEHQDTYEKLSRDSREILAKELSLCLLGGGYGIDNPSYPQNRPRDAYLKGEISHPMNKDERKAIVEKLDTQSKIDIPSTLEDARVDNVGQEDEPTPQTNKRI